MLNNEKLLFFYQDWCNFFNVQQTLKLFMLLAIVINAEVVNSQVLECDPHKQIHEEINRDLNNIQRTLSNNVLFENVNLLWPDCEKNKDKFVEPLKIQNSQLYITQDWLIPLNDCVIDKWGTFQYYKNMRNGDDWIVACSDKCGIYAQVIDGRTTTVLIKQSIYKIEKNKIEDTLLPFLDRFIQRRGYNLLAPKVTILSSDLMETIGVIDEAENKVSEKNILESKVIFWFNSKYTIIDILKNRDPNKLGKSLSLLGTSTVGGILRKDPRSFKRFDGDVIDYKKETIKQFPWLIDTIVNRLDKPQNEYIIQNK